MKAAVRRRIEDPEINMLMPGIRSQPGWFRSGEIDAVFPAGKGALAAVRTADRGRRRPVSASQVARKSRQTLDTGRDALCYTGQT